MISSAYSCRNRIREKSKSKRHAEAEIWLIGIGWVARGQLLIPKEMRYYLSPLTGHLIARHVICYSRLTTLIGWRSSSIGVENYKSDPTE